jgi:hypothetical protein
MELARQHDLTTEKGGSPSAAFAPSQARRGHPVRGLHHPVPADRYTEDLQPKTLPIRFDRTPAGEISCPGDGGRDVRDGEPPGVTSPGIRGNEPHAASASRVAGFNVSVADAELRSVHPVCEVSPLCLPAGPDGSGKVRVTTSSAGRGSWIVNAGRFLRDDSFPGEFVAA